MFNAAEKNKLKGGVSFYFFIRTATKLVRDYSRQIIINFYAKTWFLQRNPYD